MIHARLTCDYRFLRYPPPLQLPCDKSDAPAVGGATKEALEGVAHAAAVDFVGAATAVLASVQDEFEGLFESVQAPPHRA